MHQKDLISRLGDFGAHYLGRVLVACLFQSSDYVRAQRQRMRLVAEMEPLYERYDVLVTAGMGPAPRLDAHRTIGFWDKWQKPSITTVFDVTGGPAIMVPNGLSKSGLPLGMQIVGRPFEDATVLKAAYAYENATTWHKQRPALVPGIRSEPVYPEAHDETLSQIDPALRQLVQMLAGRAGLSLTEPQLLQLCEAAPYAIAMAKRVPALEWESEPANIFRFPDSLRK